MAPEPPPVAHELVTALERSHPKPLSVLVEHYSRPRESGGRPIADADVTHLDELAGGR